MTPIHVIVINKVTYDTYMHRYEGTNDIHEIITLPLHVLRNLACASDIFYTELLKVLQPNSKSLKIFFQLEL